MEQGWIKLHRQMKDWQHYQEPSVLLVFIDLLLSANSKPGWKRGQRIGRGQLVTSTAQIMESTGLGSDHTVREALRKLELSGEIRRERFGNGTKITIIQYHKYQAYANTAELGAEPAAQSHAELGAEPAADKQEYKNGRRKEGVSEFPDGNPVSGCSAPPTPKDNIKYDALVEYFNEKTKGVFGKVLLPLGEKRKAMVRARIRERGKQAFADMIEKAMASDFLKGQNGSGFTATFDWLIRPSNFEKVLSGNYDNHEGAAANGITTYKGDSTIGTEFTRKM